MCTSQEPTSIIVNIVTRYWTLKRLCTITLSIITRRNPNNWRTIQIVLKGVLHYKIYILNLNCFTSSLFCFSGNDRALLTKYITKEAGVFYCTECGQTATKRYNLLNHVENIHFAGTYQYCCQMCSKILNTKQALYDHSKQCQKMKWLVEKNTFEIKYCCCLLEFLFLKFVFQGKIESFWHNI